MAAPSRDANSLFRSGARSAEMLAQINWASLAMLGASGILSSDVCIELAEGMRQLEGQPDHAQNAPADYLDYEALLAAQVGAKASLLHLGRSRQDIAATISRMNLRLDALQACQQLLAVREALVMQASLHLQTVVPSYTHGMQAQPTTWAHYLLAFSDALGRHVRRLQQAYDGINQCPLGAAAVTTSSYPVDRELLARLLGFDGLVENSYDANHLGPVDSCLELAAIFSGFAIQVGQLAQDLHAACSLVRPWVALDGGNLMGRSSLMPQKRNPAALEQLRAQSALLLAECQAPVYLAHNVRTGMFDYRAYDPLPSKRQRAVLGLLLQVVQGLRIDADAAQAEVDAEFSTLTELADGMVQSGQVAFRQAHEFTSALADLARRQRCTLLALGYPKVSSLYETQHGQLFPLSEAQFIQCLNAHTMIERRKGRGGPQLAEVQRMIERSGVELESQNLWQQERETALKTALSKLREAY